jgi:transposase
LAAIMLGARGLGQRRDGDLPLVAARGWSQKSRSARHTRRRRQAFFLLPYSPDRNPIEQAFAKLKTLLRKAAERTVEATWKRIGSLLQAFTSQECANYFRNAGYASA